MCWWSCCCCRRRRTRSRSRSRSCSRSRCCCCHCGSDHFGRASARPSAPGSRRVNAAAVSENTLGLEQNQCVCTVLRTHCSGPSSCGGEMGRMMVTIVLPASSLLRMSFQSRWRLRQQVSSRQTSFSRERERERNISSIEVRRGQCNVRRNSELIPVSIRGDEDGCDR